MKSGENCQGAEEIQTLLRPDVTGRFDSSRGPDRDTARPLLPLDARKAALIKTREGSSPSGALARNNKQAVGADHNRARSTSAPALFSFAAPAEASHVSKGVSEVPEEAGLFWLIPEANRGCYYNDIRMRKPAPLDTSARYHGFYCRPFPPMPEE